MDLTELKRKTCDLVDPRKLDDIRDIVESDFAMLRIESDLSALDATAKFASDFGFEVDSEQFDECSIIWAFERISAIDQACRGTRPQVLIVAACDPMDACMAICCLLLDKTCDVYYSYRELDRFIPGGEDNESLKCVLKRVNEISLSIWLKPHIERILKNQASLERALEPLRTIIAEAQRVKELFESQYLRQIHETANQLRQRFLSVYEPMQEFSRSLNQKLQTLQTICEPVQRMRVSLDSSLARINLEQSTFRNLQKSSALLRLEANTARHRALASRANFLSKMGG